MRRPDAIKRIAGLARHLHALRVENAHSAANMVGRLELAPELDFEKVAEALLDNEIVRQAESVVLRSLQEQIAEMN